jgi:hypothetical protein
VPVTASPTEGRPAAAASDSVDRWEPWNTFVLIVGLTNWEYHDGFSNEPGDGYRMLNDAIEQAGVPPGNITLLENEQATKTAIEEQLTEVARKAGPGTTLIVYFGSEGYFQGLPGGGRDALISAYDSIEYDKDHPNPSWAATWVSGREVSTLLGQHWKGQRLILVSDSCYSGGFADVLIPAFATKEVAVLTSATPYNMASANWTFTNTLSHFFSSESTVLDTEHTGFLTLKSLKDLLARESRYVEEVPVTVASTASFNKSLVFRNVPKTVSRVGDYVDALYAVDQQYYRAQILDVSGQGDQAQAHVRFTWYGNQATVSLSSETRAPRWNVVRVGESVVVQTEFSGQLAGTVAEASSDGAWAMVRYSTAPSLGSWAELVSPNVPTAVGPTSAAYILQARGNP